MKTLIVIPNRSNYVLAWCLEYALYLRQKGVEVDLLDVSKHNSRYIGSPSRWLIDNLSVSRKSSRGKFLADFCMEHGLRDLTNTQEHAEVSEKNYLSKSENIYFETALRSNYSRWFGSSDIRVQDVPVDIRDLERVTFVRVLDLVISIARREKYDEIATVNGRFVPDAATVLAAMKSNTSYRVLEKMTEDWSHLVPFTISAQSLRERDSIIQYEWLDEGKGDTNSKTQIATRYLDLRTSPEWFWESNSKSVLPESLDTSRKIVVFYLTSDYEFPVYGEDIEQSLISQEDSVRIAAVCCEKMNMQLVVKGHPHPGEPRLSLIEDRKWSKICDSINVLYLKCDSGIRSMEIAGISHCNIVHGSTLAIDFIVNKLPVIATTPTDYTSLVPEICAFNSNDIQNLLNTPPIAIAAERLYPWAFASLRGGIPMKFFKIGDDMKVFYKSREIDRPSPLVIAIRKVFAKILGRTGHGIPNAD